MYVYDKWHKQIVIIILCISLFPSLTITKKKPLLSHDIVPRYETFAIEFNAKCLLPNILVRFFPYIKVIYG